MGPEPFQSAAAAGDRLIPRGGILRILRSGSSSRRNGERNASQGELQSIKLDQGAPLTVAFRGPCNINAMLKVLRARDFSNITDLRSYEQPVCHRRYNLHVVLRVTSRTGWTNLIGADSHTHADLNRIGWPSQQSRNKKIAKRSQPFRLILLHRFWTDTGTRRVSVQKRRVPVSVQSTVND
jgi:hypothetical protein